MNNDLISRQAALDALLQCRKHCIDPFDSYHIDIEDAEAMIRRVPAAQPKTAEWLPCNDRAVICSSCGAGAPHMYPYCNYCGAWMRNHDRKYDV